MDLFDPFSISPQTGSLSGEKYAYDMHSQNAAETVDLLLQQVINNLKSPCTIQEIEGAADAISQGASLIGSLHPEIYQKSTNEKMQRALLGAIAERCDD